MHDLLQFLRIQAAGSSSLSGNGFDLGIEAEGDDGGRHEGLLPPVISVAW